MDKTGRNKDRLFQALLDLMSVKPSGRISVVELTERAKVNRSSFYSLYTGIDDMLEKVEAEVASSFRTALRDYAARGNSHENAVTFFAFMFDFVADHAEVFRLLLSPDGEYIVIKKVRGIVGEYIAPSDPESEYRLAYVTFGCIGIVQRWLLGGMADSSESMAIRAVAYIEAGTGHPL